MMKNIIKISLTITMALLLNQYAVAANLDISFYWTGNSKCSSTSPVFIIKNIPDNTDALDFKLRDFDRFNVNHGGGVVKYQGDSWIEEGAIPKNNYKGPCPPITETHTYQFTVKALDSSGSVLAEGKTSKKFPNSEKPPKRQNTSQVKAVARSIEEDKTSKPENDTKKVMADNVETKPVMAKPIMKKPASPRKKPKYVQGVWSYEVEKAAEKLGCNRQSPGILVSDNKRTSTYKVLCSNREELLFHCYSYGMCTQK